MAALTEYRLLRCWGKTGAGREDFHPALFHMLDTGHVAQALLCERASARWRRTLARALGADVDSLAGWLPWLVALHDIGKISAAFQALDAEQRARLQLEGFSFGGWRESFGVYHPEISAVFVADGLGADCDAMPEALGLVWREVVGGHHGRFVQSASRLRSIRGTLGVAEPAEWRALRQRAATWLQGPLAPRPPAPWPRPSNVSTAIMCACGFTSLCDWIASDERRFALSPEVEPTAYIAISRQRAEAAVEGAGLWQPTASTAPLAFGGLFRDLGPARPLQEAIDAVPGAVLSEPCLAIIEAPTGEGKTEAALALAHRLAQASGSDELYYALPTTATSNQMFGRVQRHLRDRLGVATQVKLVHGQAFLVEDELRIEPLADEDAADSWAGLEWFKPKKRALLAPFGVGTVDQVELAALAVRYGALRQAGLAGKVLVLDEVHAYDTYMTTVVESLLRWLAALGTSVIILSATLPSSRREDLMRAYGATADTTSVAWDGYPSLWAGNSKEAYHAAPPACQPARQLELGYLHLGDDEGEAKAKCLVEAVANGGCACWIANTVGRAQEIYRHVRALVPEHTHRLLLHAQFPLEERQRLEEELTARYGPTGARPDRGIVVGTQVLEQSLDLDFDVMVSDLAPMDLLLQRAGRLHRHEGRNRFGHRRRLWINAALDAEGGLKLGADKRVYAEYIQHQTWAVLGGRNAVHLPAEYRPLVDAVYGAPEPPADSPLRPAWEKLQVQEGSAVAEARLRLWPDPDPDWPFCTGSARLTFEEDENSAAWIVARTRLGEESITVIPLERDGEQARIQPGGEGIALSRAAARETEYLLRRRGLRISRQDAVRALKAEREALPALFGESVLLRDCLPLWLRGGRRRLPLEKGALVMTLDPELGLVVARERG